MKKILRGAVLLMALGLSGCTGLELFMIGSMLGGGAVGYGKPWLDKILTPAPVQEPAREPAKPVTPAP